MLTLGKDTVTMRRPNRDPLESLDYVAPYLDSDQSNAAGARRHHHYRKPWVDHKRHSHPSSLRTICS